MFLFGKHAKSGLAATGLSLALAMGVAAPANAALIDFTDETAFPSIASQPLTDSVNGVGFNVFSYPTTFGSDGISASNCLSNPLACQRDGLGVGDDEVGDSETVTIVFDSAVEVAAMYFLDLFTKKGGGDQEVGQYRVSENYVYDNYVYDNDTSTVTWSDYTTFAADPNQYVNTAGHIGYRAVALNQTVKAIEWSYSSGNDNAGTGDYAVAGLSVAHAPLPAAAWFLLTSLGGLIGLRWLRKDGHAATA